jgi:hypothetical protein
VRAINELAKKTGLRLWINERFVSVKKRAILGHFEKACFQSQNNLFSISKRLVFIFKTSLFDFGTFSSLFHLVLALFLRFALSLWGRNASMNKLEAFRNS